MADNGNIDAKKYEHIVSAITAGLTQEETADMLSVSRMTVQRVARLEKSAKARDLEDLREMNRSSKNLVRIACQKYGITLDAQPMALPTAEPKEDNTAAAFVALLETVKELTDTVKDLSKGLAAVDQRLSAMQMTVQGIRQEAKEHATKIVETININGDIQTKEYQRQNDFLAAIKTNTKKRD